MNAHYSSSNIRIGALVSSILFHLVVYQTCFATEKSLTYLPANTPWEALIVDVLHLAIEKSGQQHLYKYQQLQQLDQGDATSLLEEGLLDVIWLSASQPKRQESQIRPIRIPILKGLLGYQIFLIRGNDQGNYKDLQTLDEVRNIPLGQGRYWENTPILKQANLHVIDPIKYQSLFYMLEGGRFDLLPRAIHQPWDEINTWQHLNLAVEQELLLFYPFPVYFYVANKNPKLGEAIKRGLSNAIADGSFDRLFYSHPLIKEILSKANLKGRRVIRITNPELSPLTPLDHPSFWLHVGH